ncbi:MAG: hypothetical protein HY334_01390, partial [Armatimonadetes bacterium]|nr:hypothetical protein [Armatimonadota bacterium]
AGRRGVRRIALLTETAAPFFHRLGFRGSARGRLDPQLLTSSQFSEPSCATAAVMTIELDARSQEAES